MNKRYIIILFLQLIRLPLEAQESGKKNELYGMIGFGKTLNGHVDDNFEVNPNLSEAFVKYRPYADISGGLLFSKGVLKFPVLISISGTGYTIYNSRKYIWTPSQVDTLVNITRRDYFLSAKTGMGCGLYIGRRMRLQCGLYLNEAVLSVSRYDEMLPVQYEDQEVHTEYSDYFSRHGVGLWLDMGITMNKCCLAVHTSIEYFYASSLASSWKSTFFNVGLSFAYAK